MLNRNKRGNNIIIIIFVTLLLMSLPLISSVSNVVVSPEPEKKEGWFSTYFGFLGSPIFWGGVVIFIFILLLLVGFFFILRWIVQFIKSKSDIYYLLKKERMKLSKIHSRYNSKHFLKVEKNTPIRLVRKSSGKLEVSEPIGNHRGDFVSHEGNVIISLNLKKNKKWLFFPITDILVIPNRDSVKIQRKNQFGKQEEITITNIPRAKDIVQFNENEILLFAESVSNVGIFYIPVLKASDGKIIDLSLPVYQSFKDLVVGDYLYQQSADFVDVAKKTIALNPNLAYSVREKDSNSNVDIPQDRQGR